MTMTSRDIRMPPNWSRKRKADFLAWLNDELSKEHRETGVANNAPASNS